MSLFKWSKTAATNATADGSINYAEGQAPSSLNDSARAAMAAVAKYRDDINGTIATGGTSTAYTVTSNQVFDTLAHMDGAMIAFVPHTTSGAAPTLNVDSLGAKKIRFQTGIDIPEGVLVAGTPYVVTYGNSATEFLLHNIAGDPYGIPVGGLMPYASTTMPNSCFVMPYGQAISRSVYSILYGRTGTVYGTGDGSTTFNIPNLMGRVIFGLDAMSGTSSGVLTSTYYGANPAVVGALGGSQSHTITANESATLTYSASVTDPGHRHTWVVALTAPSIVTGTAAANIGELAPPGVGGGYRSPIGTYPMDTATTGISVSVGAVNAGGQPHSIVPPGMSLPYIMRII